MVTGEQIRALREQFGDSQKVFAERFGLNQATLCRWEKYGIPERIAAQTLARSILERAA